MGGEAGPAAVSAAASVCSRDRPDHRRSSAAPAFNGFDTFEAFSVPAGEYEGAAMGASDVYVSNIMDSIGPDRCENAHPPHACWDLLNGNPYRFLVGLRHAISPA